MADEKAAAGKPLTGRKVFAIFAGAFTIIVGVNVFMAWSAVGTFPGLEVANTYVASQTFDADRKAQEALAWDVSAAVDGPDKVMLTILGPGGQPARVEAIDGTIGRATQRTDDQTLSFEQNDRGVHIASVTPLDAGKWELRFVATAANGVPFKQRIELVIPEE